MDAFRRTATPPRLIMAVFFMHAVVMWNWYPRIADVLAKLDVTRGDLSLGLLGGPVGTLVALVFAGLVCNVYGLAIWAQLARVLRPRH